MLSLAYRKTRCLRLTTHLLTLLAAIPAALIAQAPKQLKIAAAADLRPVMPALAEAYEHATGVKVLVSYGSSSTLTTQIINGAPFDLLLAADFSFPEKVIVANLSDMTSPMPYARGTLVLWARKDSPLQPMNIQSMIDPRTKAIAIADDTRAPFGMAAVRAMEALHVYDTVKSRIVRAENVEQAAQFAESGNAQMAFISLTLAESPHMKETGSYVRVPEVYPPINQCGVVMKGSAQAGIAHDFLRWLTSREIQEKLRSFGLTPVI